MIERGVGVRRWLSFTERLSHLTGNVSWLRHNRSIVNARR
jgi:hypothetical protein